VRNIGVVIAFALVACGAKPVSPFVDGPPSLEIQQRFLAECGVPHDGRHPGAAIQFFVRSEYPDGPFNGTMCRVRLLWKGNTIEAVEVRVDNDRAWLDAFVRSAVLPLLKPQARAVVEREFFAYLPTTPRKLMRVPALGGQVELELRWHDTPGAPTFGYGELSVSR